MKIKIVVCLTYYRNIHQPQ